MRCFLFVCTAVLMLCVLLCVLDRVRAEEVGVLLKATFLRAANEAMFFVQPAVLGFLVFATYSLLGEVLTPQKVLENIHHHTLLFGRRLAGVRNPSIVSTPCQV